MSTSRPKDTAAHESPSTGEPSSGVAFPGDLPRDIPPEARQLFTALVESFDHSTTRLNDAYAALQDRVASLNTRLEQTNRELAASLAEKERLSDYLANILESLSSGVVVIDTDGRITIFNRGAETITGIPVTEAVGAPYADIMGGAFPRAMTPLGQLDAPGTVTHREKTIRTRGGRPIPVGCSLSPLRTGAGEVIGAVEVFADLTVTKALEAEVLRMEKLAALGTMAATMAHKIRNPLGGILGFAGLLQLDVRGNESSERLLDKIVQGVEKLNRIVTSLLEYASPLTLKPVARDIGAFVRQMGGELAAMSHGCIVRVAEPDGAVFAGIDPEHFRSALAHILTNAFEASDEGGVVDLVVYPDEVAVTGKGEPMRRCVEAVRSALDTQGRGVPYAVILVADAGTGMDAETRDNLFVPFYTTKEHGIGLGLAHAVKIMEAHHGGVVVESDENAGTVVGLYLPRAAGAA